MPRKKSNAQTTPQQALSRQEATSPEVPFPQEVFAMFGEPINFRAVYHNGEWYVCLNDVIVFVTLSIP